MAYSTIHIRALIDAVRRTGTDVNDALSAVGLPADLLDGPSGVDGAHFERLLTLCLNVIALVIVRKYREQYE